MVVVVVVVARCVVVLTAPATASGRAGCARSGPGATLGRGVMVMASRGLNMMGNGSGHCWVRPFAGRSTALPYAFLGIGIGDSAVLYCTVATAECRLDGGCAQCCTDGGEWSAQ
ncbi:hypothetical protein F4803DRAFT_334121 [Xylaria telfairii]|nr:hypothetical protein F4803DRAFT_334121 [Xylaria telfairii]